MIRKLDWYVLRAFLAPLAMSSLLICSLFIIIDCINHLNDFTTLKDENTAALMFRYYLAYLPNVLSDFLLPVITLMASVFCVASLAKANELTAIKASGVPLQRQLMPIMIVVVGICLLDFFLRSELVPRSFHVLQPIQARIDGELSARGEIKNAAAMARTKRGFEYWYVGNVQRDEGKAYDLVITHLDPKGAFLSRMRAKEGVYQGGKWHLKDIRRQDLRDELGKNFEQLIIPSDVGFEQLSVQRKEPEYMANHELKAIGESHWHLERISRPALSLSSMIVFLWGMWLVLKGDSRQLFLGILRCVALVLVYFSVIWMIMQVGRLSQIDPAFVVYPPIGLLLFGGAIAYSRVQT